MGPDYELKCSKCGGIIEHDDTYDIYSDEDCIISYCVGHCTKCETEFKWQEEFEISFSGYTNFEEVS